MSALRNSVRIAAAALAVGASLAGPQGAGVAAADTSDADTSSAATKPADSVQKSRASEGRPSARAGKSTRSGKPPAPTPIAADVGVPIEEGQGTGQRTELAVESPSEAVAPGPSTQREPSSATTRLARTPSAITPAPRADAEVAQRTLPVNDRAAVSTMDSPGNSADSSEQGQLKSAASTEPTSGPTVTPSAADSNAVTAFKSLPDTPASAAAEPTTQRGVEPVAGMAAAVANPLSVLNDAVVRAFDSLSNLLSGLPAGPLNDWLQGTLLLVRRNLFNQAPTASYTQLGQLGTGQLIGQIAAWDPEGDDVVYRVVEDPTFGTVSIDSDGTYMYTPGQNFDGPDHFTVAVDNPGARVNLLDLRGGPTLLNVAVDGSITTPVGATQGYTVYNFTSRTIAYQGVWAEGKDDDKYSGPQIGTLLAPGESAHFEVTYYFGYNQYASPFFKAVDNEYNVGGTGEWGAEFHVGPFNQAWTEKCGGDCSISGQTVILTDPKGTVVDIPAGLGQEQADALNTFCKSGGAATCSFIPRNGKSVFQKADFESTYTDWKQTEAGFTNATSSDITYVKTFTSSESEDSSFDLTTEASADVFAIVSASVTRNSSQSWSKSNEYSYSVETTIRPGEKLTVEVQDPIKRVTGDFIVKIGGTTLNLRDVHFDSPDADRQGDIRFTTVPVKPGEVIDSADVPVGDLELSV